MELVMSLWLYVVPSSIYLGIWAIAAAYFNSLWWCVSRVIREEQVCQEMLASKETR